VVRARALVGWAVQSSLLPSLQIHKLGLPPFTRVLCVGAVFGLTKMYSTMVVPGTVLALLPAHSVRPSVRDVPSVALLHGGVAMVAYAMLWYCSNSDHIWYTCTYQHHCLRHHPQRRCPAQWQKQPLASSSAAEATAAA
jgi:hypothetical protein